MRVVAETITRLKEGWQSLPGLVRRRWWRSLSGGMVCTLALTAALVGVGKGLDSSGALLSGRDLSA